MTSAASEIDTADPRPRRHHPLCPRMRAAALLLCALLSSTSVHAQRPKLSSGAAAKAASQDESLGRQLASAELTLALTLAR